MREEILKYKKLNDMKGDDCSLRQSYINNMMVSDCRIQFKKRTMMLDLLSNIKGGKGETCLPVGGGNRGEPGPCYASQ